MAVLSAPQLRHLRTEAGLGLAYRELGEGPAVLLVHGWPTSSLLWRAVMPAIAEGNRVIALDLPGFGESDKPLDVRYDAPLFAGAITALLDALEVDRAAIVGHDLGGPIAVNWALDHPERLRALGLCNTLLYPEFSAAVLQFVQNLLEPAARQRWTGPEGLAEIMREGVSDPTSLGPEVLEAVCAPFAAADAREALAKAGVEFGRRRFVDIAKRLPSMTVPVRVVYGAADRVLPDVAETFTRLAGDLPQAQISALPGCGHFLQEERPAEVGTLFADFFAGIPQ